MRKFLVAGIALLTACGPLHRASTPSARIVFHNESGDQADVYAGPVGDPPTRIGTVFAGRTDTLRVPATITGGGGNIRVSARLLTRSFAPTSGQFVLREGDVISIDLPSDGRALIILPGR